MTELTVGSINFGPVPPQLAALGAAIGKFGTDDSARAYQRDHASSSANAVDLKVLDRVRLTADNRDGIRYGRKGDEGVVRSKSTAGWWVDFTTGRADGGLWLIPFDILELIDRSPRPANDNYPRIVALTGAAGSGKSTAADYLIRQHGYERVKFAGPLKAMLKAAGLTDNQIEGTDKEKPTRLLQGKTPRHAMQTLGHEWGRNCIGEGFWVFLFEHVALQIVDNGGRVVVDDLRFPNEAAAVRALGGVIVKLEGRGGIAGTHASEAGCGQADAIVDNDGCVTDLYAGVDEAIRRAA